MLQLHVHVMIQRITRKVLVLKLRIILNANVQTFKQLKLLEKIIFLKTPRQINACTATQVFDLQLFSYCYDYLKWRNILFLDSDFNDMADIKSVAADIIELDSNNLCTCKATGYVLSDNNECFRCAKEDSIQGFEIFSKIKSFSYI